MKYKNAAVLGLGIILTAGTACANTYDYSNQPYAIQALLGGARYDGLEFTTSDDGTEEVITDMSRLPQLGGAWCTRPKGDRLQFGLEASFLLGFKFDDVTTYNGQHAVYVNVSSSLWLFDVAGGAYVNLPLGSRLRLYGGAGPLMMFSIYSSETDYNNVNQSETEFGFGVYARTGLELQVQPGAYLGAGLRGTYSDLDFTEVGGSSELKGIAVFITYTVGL